MTFVEKFNNYNLNIHGVRLPQFDIESRHKHQALVSEDCTNYDFLRPILPDNIADSITGKILDPDEPITAEHLTTEQFTVLKKATQIALDQNSPTITYNIWREVGAGGISKISSKKV